MNAKSRDLLLALALLSLFGLLLAAVVRQIASQSHVAELQTTVRGFIEKMAIPRAPVDQGASPVAPPAGQADRDASVPLQDMAPGSTTPGAIASPASWITGDDYPAEALRNGWEGTVAIRWTIDETGRVTDCRVAESSGHAVLDEASCRLITTRARYVPAHDAQGKPMVSHDRRRIIWRLPH